MTTDVAGRLAALAVFEGCTPDELRFVADVGSVVAAPSGHHFTVEGTRGGDVFVVLEGTATCEVDGLRVRDLVEGDLFGEMAFAAGAARTATVTARTPVTVLVIDAMAFGSLMEHAPGAARRMLDALARRLREHGGLPPHDRP